MRNLRKSNAPQQVQPVSVGEAGMAVGAFIGACVAGVFAGAFVVLRAAFAPSPKRQALPKQPEYFLPTVSGYPKGTYERTVEFELSRKIHKPMKIEIIEIYEVRKVAEVKDIQLLESVHHKWKPQKKKF
jgi:hypothetical protein